ncbi:hypothetical protein N7508_009715 [Penicillium antarcticum]|uniref:uncharacterized protein n=1 Tax=Penicillium antarcticum TaxID=416450 RepID=UPI0023A76913|nr:uncharacterized protein N7508_009715 [Penicillium antarcticum]KAJ5294894.1 hypothetical protein N7508_009715 [Penicillium antarcticum]
MADLLGSNTNLDLLVLYHKTSNGVKQVITEGKMSSMPKKANAKSVADKVLMTATIFDYLRDLSDKWTKPSQNIELISDEFDAQYTRQYVNKRPAGKPLEMPKAPRDVKHWGLRTIWAYWIDRHLGKVEQVQADWHKTAKGKMEGLGVKDPNAKKFAYQFMTTRNAAVGNLKFPQNNPGKPLAGTATSSSNDQSKYGMWGDNQLGKLGL